MKEILLVDGQVALVDDEDYENLARYKWYPFKASTITYAARPVYLSENRTSFAFMHRDITHDPQGMKIIHLDGNGLKNVKENLKIVPLDYEPGADKREPPKEYGGFKDWHDYMARKFRNKYYVLHAERLG